MKGFTKDDKFHPIKPHHKKGNRMTRDVEQKTKGVRMKKNAFTPTQDGGMMINVKELGRQLGEFKIQEFVNGQWRDVKYGGMGATYIGEDSAKTDARNHSKGRMVKTRIIQVNNREKRELTSGGIPPDEIYSEDLLERLGERYFLVREYYPDSLGVDEYQKKGNNEFVHLKTVLFAQGNEQMQELFENVGEGVKKTESGYELSDEKNFIKGLKGAGGLDD